MRVLVTGASGFIGSELLRELAGRGWTVRGLVRSDDLALPPGVERARANGFSRHHIADAVRDVQAIVHLAGRAHVGGRAAHDVGAFRRANVDGTAVLLDAARAAGARLFIYLSSMAVFGEASAPLDETAVPHPRTAYGVSKLEAERLVRSAGEGPGFATIVVRPPMVYGPGMKGNPLRLFRWIHSGRSVPFGSIHNLRSILYSGNLTAALIRIMECAADRSDLFHVADPDPVSLRDLSRWIGADFDAEGRIVAIPPWLLAWTARCMSAVPERFRLGAGGAELRRAMQDFVVDTRRIQRTLGFEAPFGTREGVALTAQWFRRAHAPSATAGQVS